MNSEHFQAVILVVLDRYSSMDSEDVTPAMCELLKRELGAHVSIIEIVPDETDIIATHLAHYSEGNSIDLVLTIGGTGFFPSNNNINSIRELVQPVRAGLEQSMDTLNSSEHEKEGVSRGLGSFIGNRTIFISLPGPQIAALENLTRIIPVLERTLRRLHPGEIQEGVSVEGKSGEEKEVHDE